MEEKIIDPTSGLEVRRTDNNKKEDDPKQIAQELAEPLLLGENGLPIALNEEE